MLQHQIYYIIGNAYKKFANMPGAISYTEIINTTNNNKNYLQNAFLALGQGLNPGEKEKLRQLEGEGKLGCIINRHHKLAPCELSHKMKVHNTMISEPLVIEKDKTYAAYLLLDDDCAEMSDHITGMHLQGMVLTEAARQMMLAVGEKFVLPDNLKGNAYFALRKVNSEYHQFVFPVDVQLIHAIKSSKTRRGMCIVETVTSVMQNEKKVAEVEIDYVVSNKAALVDRETSMAESALRHSAERDLAQTYMDLSA